MMSKNIVFALGMAATLLAGCENDDSPMQPGDCTISVVNSTQSTIHVVYQTQTLDVLWPYVDVAHEADVNIAPGQEKDLWVHFNNELGTSRIVVTKDDMRKNYDVGFGSQTLKIREDDFINE